MLACSRCTHCIIHTTYSIPIFQNKTITVPQLRERVPVSASFPPHSDYEAIAETALDRASAVVVAHLRKQRDHHPRVITVCLLPLTRLNFSLVRRAANALATGITVQSFHRDAPPPLRPSNQHPVLPEGRTRISKARAFSPTK